LEWEGNVDKEEKGKGSVNLWQIKGEGTIRISSHVGTGRLNTHESFPERGGWKRIEGVLVICWSIIPEMTGKKLG